MLKQRIQDKLQKCIEKEITIDDALSKRYRKKLKSEIKSDLHFILNLSNIEQVIEKILGVWLNKLHDIRAKIIVSFF